jgi:putative endonuclease
MSGSISYHKGRSAEAQVLRHYEGRGLRLAAERWRGSAGEIDLVLRDRDALVFVEVKCSDSFATAAAQLSHRQMARICQTASEFVAGEPKGQDSEMRFDVALVDGRGDVEIRAAAFGV